tara:strand:- start:237 stop:404 length:168 start_codon:yes stop_codon:yes gene_type:complete
MDPCEAIVKLNKLVGDLFWEKDRMSSSGVETLNELADLVDNIQGVIMYEFVDIEE